MSKRISVNYNDPITHFFLAKYERVDFLRKLNKRLIEDLSFHLNVRLYEFN